MAVGVTKPDLPDLKDYVELLEKVWKSRMLTNNGIFVRELTDRLIRRLKARNLVLVNNGTSALLLAIKALGIKGEVITTPFTFAATTNVLLWEGLRPRFVDIDRETFNLDPGQIERSITPDTEAILPVHAYGNPADISSIGKIADTFGLKVIYDAAQAFNVKYLGKSVMNYGDVSTLSFHATKTFHTVEGGAISTASDDLENTITLMRNHGIESEESVAIPGINAKMDEFQAIMGLLNLEKAEERIAERKMVYRRYKDELGDLVSFQKLTASQYNYGYFPIVFGNRHQRDVIYERLRSIGFLSRKYFYPLTNNFSYAPNYSDTISVSGNLENAHYISERVLCLPIYPGIDDDSVNGIVSIIKKYLSPPEIKA